MEVKPLTQEEIEERKELFEYEMMEFAIKLKGRFAKYDRNGSPLKDSGLTEKDFKKNVGFVPVTELEIAHNMPEVPRLKQTPEYVPVVNTDRSPVLQANPDLCTAAKRHSVFMPITGIVVENDRKDIPKSFVKINYAPFKEVRADIRSIDVPEVNKVSGYMPLQGIRKTKTVEIPVVREVKEYMPLISAKVNPVGCSLPEVKAAPIFKPFKNKNANRIYAKCPILGRAPAIEAMTEVKVNQAECRIPDTSITITFTAAVDRVRIPKCIECPKTVEAVEFIPVVPGKMRSHFTVPRPKAAIDFKPCAKSLEPPLHIACPQITRISDYEPVSGVSVESSVAFDAMPEINITYSFDEVKKSLKKSPDAAIPKNIRIAKDFYSMWAAM